MTMPDDANRRALLGGLVAGMAGAAAATAWPATAEAASAVSHAHGAAAVPIESRFLRFSDPLEEFRAHFRFERDLRDASHVVSWYHFTVFAVPENSRPVPVVRFEGMEFSYFRRVKENVWRIYAHNVSFPRRLEDGAFASEIVNPITGATVTPASMVLLGDPGVLFGPKGYIQLDSKDPRWVPAIRLFRIEGNKIIVDHTRPAPAGWPMQFIETSTNSVARRAFDDPKVTSLQCETSGFYISPWSKWLAMGDAKGHAASAWLGRKLGSVDELPVEFRSRVEREHPELLRPQWQRFDQPLPGHLDEALL